MQLAQRFSLGFWPSIVLAISLAPTPLASAECFR